MMKEKPIICNGIRPGSPDYSERTEDLLRWCIDSVRRSYILGNLEMRGERFLDDDKVLERISSSATEPEVLKAPLSWTHAALQDCASADYYYTYEKRWD